MASPSKPSMPCIANPKPTSASPIPFGYERRHFTVKTLPDSFPYEVIRDNGLQIHYFEFRGQGPPPADLGFPGDVWLNVTPGELSLYARTLNEWAIWPGPRKAKKQMFEHPLVPGRYLWCTRKHVLWYTCDGIRKSASLQTRGEEEDFGRTRYRTVGPMERGGARNANDNAPRFPLRTAEEAVAKILEVESEDRRHGRDPPEPKRRRVREGGVVDPHPPPQPQQRAKSISEEPTPGSTSSGSRTTATTTTHDAPQAPAWNGDGRFQRQVNYNPGTMSFYPVSPSSSLSQALGPNAVPNPQPPSPPAIPPREPVSGPTITTFATAAAATTTTPTISAAATLSPSSTSITSTLPPHPSPATYPQHPHHPQPRTSNFPADAEINRIREEALRLSAENARLCVENTRLLEENRSLRTNAYCSPSLAEAFRDALGTTLGSRVNELLRDVQEQRAARLEAERKLVEFQEQLKKVLSRQHEPVGGAFTTMQMTQAFQLPTINTGNAGDAQLPSARPGTRLATSDT